MKAWINGATIALVLTVVAGAPAMAQDSEAEAGQRGIYRSVDKHGNTVFTDSPGSGEEVRVGPTNTMEGRRAETRSAPSAEAPESGDDEQETADYTRLEITSPEPDATLRMPQDNPVSIQVSATPELQAGHRLVILDNGTPLDGQSLENPNPGAHSLQAVIEDGDGQRLMESDPVTVYVHRSTAANQSRGENSAYPAVGSQAERGLSAGRGGSAASGSAAARGEGGSRGQGASRVSAPGDGGD